MKLKNILSGMLVFAILTAGSALMAESSNVLGREISAFLESNKIKAATPAAAAGKLRSMAGKDGRAAALYGICCKQGYGVRASAAEAQKYFLIAAGKNDPIGQFWAGYAMLRGEGVKKNVQKGVDLLESAAVQGISDAMLILARVYLEGCSINGHLVIAADHPLALRYLRRAAAGGNKRAAVMLGNWYMNGGAVKTDLSQAKHWFTTAGDIPEAAGALAEIDYLSADAAGKPAALAVLETLAANGNPRAMTFVAGMAVKSGDLAKAAKLYSAAKRTSYPPAFTGEAKLLRIKGDKKWLDLMNKAAAMGDPEAMAVSGYYAATKLRGSARTRGLAMLESTARRGVIEAMVKLGRLQLEGRLVPKDENSAFINFRTGAAHGNIEARYFMALCYLKGIGCKADPAMAAALAKNAAEAGDSYAQTLYATLLRDGNGVQRDSGAAMAWYEKAAKQGNTHASAALSDLLSKAADLPESAAKSGVTLVQKAADDGDINSAYSLGKMYTEGNRLPRDFNLGRKNLEAAVKKKYAPAYALLADYYFNGWGVKVDRKKAYALLNAGAKARDGQAVFRLGQCKLNGVGTRPDVNGALKLFRQAASLGCSDGELWQGLVKGKGMLGVSVNEKAAYQHYRKAAMMGNDSALFMLALCCKDGFGTKKNMVAAFAYLKQAAGMGNSNAMYELGLMYANGVHTPKNITEAVSWFRKSAEAGNSYGVYELACCYESGRGVKKDLRRAASLYRVAASAGNSYAQFMTGRCYEGGIGVPQDKYEAIKWYRKAAAGGFKYAGQKAAELKKQMEEIIL